MNKTAKLLTLTTQVYSNVLFTCTCLSVSLPYHNLFLAELVPRLVRALVTSTSVLVYS